MHKPNILVVMADQLAPHFTRAYGHPLVRTPAMEALAERGVRFDDRGDVDLAVGVDPSCDLPVMIMHAEPAFRS